MAKGKVWTYNSKEIILSFGSHMVTGLADDSFVTITETGGGVTSQSGADGEVLRSIDPDDRFEIKVTLQQSSLSSKWLHNRYKQDKKDGNGGFPLSVKDLKGGSIFTSDEAWAMKEPDWVRGKEGNNREWNLQCGEGNLADE